MTRAEDLSVWVRRLSLLMWGVVGAAIPLEMMLRDQQMTVTCAVDWVTAFSACGLAFWLTNRLEERGQHALARPLLLALQVGTALYMIWGWRSTTGSFLLVFTAWQAARAWPLRVALGWALGQTVLLGAVMTPLPPHLLWLAVTLVSGGLQGFAALLAHLARSEAEARLGLARTNAELRGVHELLEQSGRSAERLRLARELHDGMGHRLTALNLALEAGLHQEAPAARESLLAARAVTRQLLAELRGMVGSMRSESPIDLLAALQALAEGIHSPAIRLAVTGRLDILDPARAHAIVRCTQEFITNAIKHAAAHNLWLEVQVSKSGVLLSVRDDGRGCAKVEEGHGLTGMRERLALLRGRLGLEGGPPGFAATVWLPANEVGG